MFNKFYNFLNYFLKKRDTFQIKTLIGKQILERRRSYYDQIDNLNDVELKIFSQNGEDGIIDYLLNKIEIKDPKFIEIGTEQYEEANTRFLYEAYNSYGVIIDQGINLEKTKSDLEFWRGRIKVLKKNVSSSNIDQILKFEDFKNVDLFSIDIDGIDYWVIKKIPKYFSKIFIAEYNPIFGSNIEVTVPDHQNFDRTAYHYSNLCWGVSLKGLVNLMKEKGFCFLGVNNMKNNAFFVQEKYKNNFLKILENKENFNSNFNTNNLFMESRDQKGNLTFLNKNEQIKKIRNCDVFLINEKKIVKFEEIEKLI